METAADILKFGLRPSSITFVIVAVAVGTVLTFFRRSQRHVRWYWLAFLLGYTLLATPAFAEWFAGRASGDFRRLERAADARGARIIVVLSGGARTLRDGPVAVDLPVPGTVMRAMEAARIYWMLGDPQVILSGGVTDAGAAGPLPESEAMRDIMVRLGVPASRLQMESTSTTTRTQAAEVRRLLGGRAGEPIVLVTSPPHMRRSIAVFRAAGMDPVPATAPARADRSAHACRWCPDDDALILSDSVVYDRIAWLYYRARGWVSPAR